MRAVRSCITSILVFAAGLAIGLVVLGWWLYPVQWENGNMEVVNSVQQEDYLRAAIDSYELNGDQNLAINRYGNLGAFGPATLSTIQENPGSQNPQSIQNFSMAVVGGDGTVVVPETTPEPDLAGQFRRSISDPKMAAVLFLGLLLIIVLIAIFFVVRRGRKKEAEVPVTPEGEAPEAVVEDKMVEAPIEDAAVEGEAALVVEEVAAESEAEASAEEGDGLGLAGIAAAGVVAAAALSGDEDEEAAPEAEVVEAVEAAEETAAEDEGGMGVAGLAAAGLAGAAVVAAAKGDDEQVEVEVPEGGAEVLPENPEGEWLPEGEPAADESGLGAGRWLLRLSQAQSWPAAKKQPLRSKR